MRKVSSLLMVPQRVGLDSLSSDPCTLGESLSLAELHFLPVSWDLSSSCSVMVKMLYHVESACCGINRSSLRAGETELSYTQLQFTDLFQAKRESVCA